MKWIVKKYLKMHFLLRDSHLLQPEWLHVFGAHSCYSQGCDGVHTCYGQDSYVCMVLVPLTARTVMSVWFSRCYRQDI